MPAGRWPLAAGGYVRLNHLDVLLWQNWMLNRQAAPDGSLELGRYKVAIEAREVPGVDDDRSSLTKHWESGHILLSSDESHMVVG